MACLDGIGQTTDALLTRGRQYEGTTANCPVANAVEQPRLNVQRCSQMTPSISFSCAARERLTGTAVRCASAMTRVTLSSVLTSSTA